MAGRRLFVYRMEFDKTRWSCSWNSDQNCTKLCQMAQGVGGHGGIGGGGGPGGGGLFDMKLTPLYNITV